MNCESIQFDLPLYLDSRLTDGKSAAIDSHLPTCPLCRKKLDEYRLLRNELRSFSVPEIPAALLKSVRSTVAEELTAPTINIGSAPPPSLRERISYWFMPYSVGSFAAILLTFLLLTSLSSTRDAANTIARNESSPTTILLADSGANRIQDRLSLPPDYTKVAIASNAPKVNPAGALYALTKSIVRGKMADQEVVIVADVFGNGLATISEVVKPPSNKRALRELEKAFRTNPENAPFLPPKMEGDSEAVRVVLKIQRVDVPGHSASN